MANVSCIGSVDHEASVGDSFVDWLCEHTRLDRGCLFAGVDADGSEERQINDPASSANCRPCTVSTSLCHKGDVVLGGMFDLPVLAESLSKRF